MPHTRDMEITLKQPGRKPKTFVLPLALRAEIESFIAANVRKTPKRDMIAAEDVLPVLADNSARPAAVLRGHRYRKDMTQQQLAKKLGIRQHHLSEMENGKRPIGKKMAKRLAKVLDANFRVFL